MTPDYSSSRGSGNNPSRDLGCIHEWFEAQAERTPDEIAVESGGQAITYRELNERANSLAMHLRRQGVGPNQFVGVCLERSLEMVIAIYGVLKSGGAYVPLDPAYPEDRLQFMAKAAGLRCLVTHSAYTGLFSGLNEVASVHMDHSEQWWDIRLTENLPALATPDNLIYVIFTSGSTGQPKAAAVYHRGFSNLVQWFVREFEIDSRDHCLLVSSLSFDLTQKNLFATLSQGGTLHLYPTGPYDISRLTQLIRQHQITLINCTPSAFYPLIEPFTEVAARDLSSLRVVYLGGEPINVDRVRVWLSSSHTRAEVANTYGPTECTDICGFYRLTGDNLDQYEFVPLGRAIHNVQMVILDVDLKPCPVGEAGELCVGGAGVGAGYINDLKLTQEKFVEHGLPDISSRLLYRTGDQARLHADGVIEFLGRLDHQVKIRGYRIELAEIERAMEVHPLVREAIVVLRGSVGGGEQQLVGCVTTTGDELSNDDLRTFLAKKLPPHMIPSSFILLSAFPLSPNGKVDRKALTQLVAEQSLPPQPAVCSGTSGGSAQDAKDTEELRAAATRSEGRGARPTGLEDKLQSLWCELLNRKQAGLDDNFFDLGGDSLRLARLHQAMESLLRQSFPITDLFAHPTIRGIVRHLSDSPKLDDKQQKMRDRARLQRQAMGARRRPGG